MVFLSHGLVPTRFLTLLAHMTISILILWSRDENVKACLPFEYSEEEYADQDLRLVVGLSVALGLIGFELFGFLSGITMFTPSTAMISIASHASASVLLTYFVLDEWDCNLYWWVFTFCSAVPAFFEAVTILGRILLRR